MKKSDFKVGQTVCLLILENSNACRGIKDRHSDERFIEAIVTKIDTKYICVKYGLYGYHASFKIDNNFRQFNIFGDIDYALYLSKEDARNSVRFDEQ